MLEFCPLCGKNGFKRKTKLFQINLEEAVWLCEFSECPWPFGYQNFTFVSRKVGETWSSEWDLHKPATSKPAESFQISLNELGLDTPPVTPGSGYEFVHKDSVFGDNTSSATSLNSNTNTVNQTKVNFGSQSHSNKLGHSYSSEYRSINSENTGTRVSVEVETSSTSVKTDIIESKDQELLTNVNHSIRNDGMRSKLESNFSLSDDVNFRSLDKCFSISQGFSEATESGFNLGQSLKDDISFVATESLDNLYDNANHESTFKCKEWLKDNTKSTVLREHSYSSFESEKIIAEPTNVSSRVLSNRLQRDGMENLNNMKQLPIVKSIEITNVKLAGAASTSNRGISHKHFVSKVTADFQQNNNSHSVFGDLPKNVKDGVGKKRISTNTAGHDIVGSKFLPQSYSADESSSGTCKIDYKTVGIDGSSSINLSNEIPSSIQERITLPWSTNYSDKVKKDNLGCEPVIHNPVVSIKLNIETTDQKTKSSQSARSNKTEIQRQSMKKLRKRTIPKLAKYQGFDFAAVKKKKTNTNHNEENIKFSLPGVRSPDNISICAKVTCTSKTPCATMTTVNSKSESNSSNIDINSPSTLTVENCSLTTSNSDLKSTDTCDTKNPGTLRSNLDLDLILDNMMRNDNTDLPQDFNDDWLVSLFE